jgi:hypothetical protein
MSIQEFIEDFTQQKNTAELNLQKLQQQIQTEQQLFLKLQGAVEALSLYDSQNAPTPVEVIDQVPELEEYITPYTPVVTRKGT